MNTPFCARQAMIGAGANLGDRWVTLRGAVECLRAHQGVLAVESSSVFETDPVGGPPQPRFLNLVLGVETTLSPEDLLATLLEIEARFGRVRRERWGPRTLDLDLLLFENEVRRTSALELPHPRMFERSFVTEPLKELLAHPRFQSPVWDQLRHQLGARASHSSAGLRRFAL